MFNNYSLNLNMIGKNVEDNILWLKVAKSQRVFSKRKYRKSLSVHRFPFVFLQIIMEIPFGIQPPSPLAHFSGTFLGTISGTTSRTISGTILGTFFSTISGTISGAYFQYNFGDNFGDIRDNFGDNFGGIFWGYDFTLGPS